MWFSNAMDSHRGNGCDEHDGAGGCALAGCVGDEAGGDAARDPAHVEQRREIGSVGFRDVT